MQDREKTNPIQRFYLQGVLLVILLFVLRQLLVSAYPASAFPDLKFPFPCNETWKISNDYAGHQANCDGDPNCLRCNQYALDFINTSGNADGRHILASGGGTASLAHDPSGGGFMVKIDHGGGYETWYAHLYQDGRKSGSVSQGDVIGLADSSGSVTGPHIHFALLYNGESVKPEPMSGHIGFEAGQEFISDNGCGPDPKQASDLVISPSNSQVNQAVTFSFSVRNHGSQSITFQHREQCSPRLWRTSMGKRELLRR